MKLSFFFALLAASALLTGCGSLDNPFTRFFHTGNDARVFNAQTGQYEWPEEKKSAEQRKAPAVAAALAGAPASQERGDGRYFDAQKNQWIEVKPEGDDGSAKRPKPTPRPPATAGAAPEPLPPPTPGPTPLPARATGYYNTSTGKIEWASGATAAAAPTPAPRKHWWWPF
jgi:hypothetical protein